MPLKTRRQPVHEKLLAKLTERLRADAEKPVMPLVVLSRVGATRTQHVVVIWDEWANVPSAERSGLITDAIHAARPEDLDTLTIAMGLTPREALSLGYLPFHIVPAARASDRVRAADVAAAMRAAGGILLEVDGAKQIRFATRAQAEQAYRALATRVPAPIWTLVHELPVAETA